VKARLARARERLRWRLDGRGWASLLSVAPDYLPARDAAAVPRLLLDTTTRAAVRFAALAAAGEPLSVSVLAIAHGVLKAMLINKLSLAAIPLTGVAAVGLGAMVLARQAPGERQTDGQPLPVAAPANDAPQSTVLRLNGSTDYVPATTARIHAPFDCRVDKVFVDLGSKVSNGDPILELFSAELSEAKSNYEAASSQWARDKKMLDYKTPLAIAHNISRTALIEVENDEAQSRLKMKLAKDKLLIYGLSDAEIENAKDQDGIQKAKMLLRSRAGGGVVQRDVVPGNYYTPVDTLLVIAGIDTLLVRAKIDSRDAGGLEVGQRVTVAFPFGDRSVNARLEAISRDADPETGEVTVRTSIPNPDHRLKGGMLVRLDVELGPRARPPTAAASPVEPKPDPSLDDRLNAVERKLEQLLDEKDNQSTQKQILRRMSELERKLDRALNLGTGK
jgi:multidrug efflux pump subunit AcrA (membrane-fusion protein)